MPLFMVEREFVDRLELDNETVRAVDAYNAEHDITWLTSFLSADRKKTYCLYESDDVETLRRQAADLGLPADSITPVDEFLR